MSGQAKAYQCDDLPSDEEFIPGGLLGELDAQQDEVLRRLDELNGRIEHLMKDWSQVRPEVDAADAA